MYLIQSVKKDDKWVVLQKDRYTMPVTKLCNRLNQRSPIRGEYIAKLRKYGFAEFERNGELVRIEIKLEQDDERYKFKDPSSQHAADSESSAVHSGWRDPGAVEQPGSEPSAT